MPKKETILKHATIYAAYILIVWGFYRLIFKLPDEVEELFVKPVIWLLPILFILKKEKLNLKSLGFNFENFYPVVYSILGLGAVFVIEALIVNYLKYGGLNFGANIGSLPLVSSIGLSFATAFSEEISFRGYLFNRVWLISKSEWWANLSTNFVWVLIHVPVTFFVLKMSLTPALIYLGITAIFGIGSAYIFARTKNVFASIILHVLWEWPIILFR
jgi:membrane protease YdiL (CAAX protease family)